MNNTLQDILYPCKFDRTMQPAKFIAAEGTGPRPMAVCLHTWSADHEQKTSGHWPDGLLSYSGSFAREQLLIVDEITDETEETEETEE